MIESGILKEPFGDIYGGDKRKLKEPKLGHPLFRKYEDDRPSEIIPVSEEERFGQPVKLGYALKILQLKILDSMLAKGTIDQDYYDTERKKLFPAPIELMGGGSVSLGPWT